MPNVSHQQIINSLWREGDYWDQTTITYSIPATSPESSFNESGGFQPIGYGATRIAAEAFELWDDLIAINLNENTTTNANITLAYTTAPHEGDLFGYARTDAEDGATDYVIENAKVWINANKINPQDVSAGTYGFFTYVHEIGHALGLDHPGNYNHDDDEYDYATDRGHEQDTRQYTAMSYFAAGKDGSGANHNGSYAATPLLHDIMAIQAIYGKDMTTRTADTVYGFNSTANRLAFDFEHNQKPVVAIWDAGGVDTLDTSGFTQDQKIDLHAGAFSDVGGLSQNVAIAYECDIENAVGGTGNDTLIGNRLANRLEGRDGADTFRGGGGVDTLVGGLGHDHYYLENADDEQDIIIEGVGEGIDTVFSKVTHILAPNVESLTLDPSAGNINGYGNGLANTLSGNSGANVLMGGLGDDVLFGGGGWDTMWGGEGDDTYSVDTLGNWSYVRDANGNVQYTYVGGDRVVELANHGFDTVVANVSYTLGDNVEGLTLLGFANLDGFGNGLDNVLKGNTSDNHLYGYAGADLLDGGHGSDTMYGGTGNDTYVVTAGDAVVERAGEGIDTVRSFETYTLGAHVENLSLTGGAVANGYGNTLDNVLTGNTASNHLLGNAGADRLDGGYGADTLDGGIGADFLIGGFGNDTFVFNARQASGDTIVDFAGNGAGAGDQLQFVGFGTARGGATFTQIDATHWQIHSGLDGHNEVITILSNERIPMQVHMSDYLFV